MMNIDSSDPEQFLLGSLLHNPHGLGGISISPSDFGVAFHGELFTDICEKFTEHGDVNLGHFTGPPAYTDYIRGIHELPPYPSNESIKNYADIVLEAATKRRIIEACDRIKGNTGLTSADMIALISEATANRNHAVNIKSAETVHGEIMEALTLPTSFHPCGIDALDVALAGGFYPGFTYGFCGAEKSGKTTLAHTLSYNLAANGCPHLYVALEMGSQQIEQKNIARDMGINSLSFLNGRAEMLKGVSRTRPRANLFYLDQPGATLHDILTGVSASMLKHSIKGFIVDYWQLVQGQDGRETEEKHLRHVAQSLANFARKNGLWCILLAQMNQDGKLFGGNGLRKACDQLYMIEQIEGMDECRWLRMDASRYTLRADVGDEHAPSIEMDRRVGPYFKPF